MVQLQKHFSLRVFNFQHACPEHPVMHQMCVCELYCTIFKVLILSFLKIVAVYPPTSGPSTSMYGNVPGYEGTLAGGGKFTAYSHCHSYLGMFLYTVKLSDCQYYSLTKPKDY